MNQTEMRIRLTAWTWAATTLGVEASPDRLRGLVETTRKIPAEHLKAALEEAINAETSSYRDLPTPAAVLQAAREISRLGFLRRPKIAGARDEARELRRLEGELNPEEWPIEKWAAFSERLKGGSLFADRVALARDARMDWAEEQAAREIAGRKVSMGFRIELRRRLNLEAFDHFPRPDPFADGWVRARDFDPIAGLSKSLRAEGG